MQRLWRECNTTATLLQHYCKTSATHWNTLQHTSPLMQRLWRGCSTTATLLQHYCKHYCNTTATRLQHYCNTTATVLQHYCNTLQHTATHSNTNAEDLEGVQHYCSTTVTLLQHYCNTTVTLLLHNATHSNTLQHTSPLMQRLWRECDKNNSISSM